MSGTICKGIGGMEVHLDGMLNALATSSCYERIVLITKQNDCITMREVKNPRVCFFDGFAELAARLRLLQADVLFFNDGHFIEHFHELRTIFPNALFVMRSGGNEFVKAPWSDMSLPLSARQTLWSKAINDNADYVIANSTYTWQRMIQIGIAREKILIVRGGVDLVAAAENVADKTVLRREFDKIFGTSSRYIFCIAARHVKFKGIADVLKIFAGLKQSRKWFLLIAGEGNESAALWRYCTENLSEDSFAFVGAIKHEDVMKYIALSDCLLSCSVDTLRASGEETYIHTETMGRGIIEAVCQRVPVIATTAGGVREWFEEIPGTGVLLPDEPTARAMIIRRAFEDGLSCSVTKALDIYGWEYIVNFFYAKLFAQRRTVFKSALCFDLEGSVVHSFLSAEENVSLLERIFLFASAKCELIINSAGDFYEIINRYPIIADNLARLTIIANGGKIIVNHGQHDVLWQEYHNMQPAIALEEMTFVENEIRQAGISLIRKKIVDKLYVNFKVSGSAKEIAQIASRLNESLRNPSRQVVSNSDNIKLISQIINKGSALEYLKNFQLKCDWLVGVGNDILDELFLAHCDKSFVVNPVKPTAHAVAVGNFGAAKAFVDRLQDEVGLS